MNIHVRGTSNDIWGNVLLHPVLPERIVRSRLFVATYNTTSYHVVETSIKSRYSSHRNFTVQ